MDWITKDIAIGNYLEAQDAALLRQHGIRSVLSLDDTLLRENAAELGLMEIASIRLADGAGNDLRRFLGAIEALQRLALELPPVLVQCHAGRSRSAAVLAGYLILTSELDPDEATAAVASKRTVSIAPELIELLWKL